MVTSYNYYYYYEDNGVDDDDDYKGYNVDDDEGEEKDAY